MSKNYWLFKSEPDCWSWQEQLAKGAVGEEWSGVRNYEARNNMLKMRLGDEGFFYHSNKEKAIVGIVKICKTAHQDSTIDDIRWQCVDVAAVRSLTRAVTLKEIKSHPDLQNIALIKRSRLSVAPINAVEWEIINQIANQAS